MTNKTSLTRTLMTACSILVLSTVMYGCVHSGDDAPVAEPPPIDMDGDGVADADDAFPNDPTETVDSDGDGVGDNADAFPMDATETADLDGDGTGDNADTDRDGDGVANADDAFPDDAMETADLDMDGVGDNADPDRDGDGIANVADRFPDNSAETQDSDEDGVGNNTDAFPFDGSETADSDGDGVGDNADAFPLNAMETADSDEDGVGDNADAFPGHDDQQGVRLFQAANAYHVIDLEGTMADEKAAHVTSVGGAMAAIAAAPAGIQAAGTTASATWPGDTVDNPDTESDEFAEGMLTISVDPGGSGTPIPFNLMVVAADPNASPPVTAVIQTAMEIDSLGVFQGYDLWEDDGTDATGTDLHNGDGARAIVFTNKQQGDDSVLDVTAATARSVVAQTVAATELAKVTSTASTITGVEWTPSGQAALTGTLTCGDSCSITLGADGAVTDITGYTFTGSRAAVEAATAANAAENNDYLLFGLWSDESDDGATDTFGAFADGGTGYDVNVQNAVTGTANYSGKAAGAHHRTGEGVNWFDGNARLTANFGTNAAAGTISGAISNIRVNGGEAMSTPIYLGQTALSDGSATFNGAAFMGAETAPGAPTHEFDGTWSGSFFGATEDDTETAGVDESITAPLAAAGTFGVTKSEGTGDDMVMESFVGAFGAHKDE